MNKMLIVAPKTNNLINFRGDLMKDIIKKGYEVVAIVPEKEEEDYFEQNGIKLRFIELDKNSFSLLKAYSYYRELIRIMKEEKPDKVFSYTIKPVVFGSLAASKAKVKEIYSLVCGLGYLFSVNTLKVKLLRTFCGLGYKWALSKNTKVIFQNQDDIDEFTKRGYVKKDKCELVNGSGVNLEKFTKNDIPTDKVSFIMVSRILKEKGVLEYFEAAKIVKEKHPYAKFVYIGAIDKNVNAVSLDILKPYIDNYIVEYIPETNVVEQYLAKSSVFVLPSYYREGIPKSIIEGTAMGRPIITTDTPGCRETVQVGINGFFVEPKNVNDLADKMTWMIENKDKLQEMGNKSYELCLSKFTIDIINKDMMRVMNIKMTDEATLNV